MELPNHALVPERAYHVALWVDIHPIARVVQAYSSDNDDDGGDARQGLVDDREMWCVP